MDQPLADGGYASRKLHLSYAAMFLIFSGGVLAAKWAAFAVNYPTLVGGILGAVTIYTGGNVAVKHVLSKNLPASSVVDAEGPKEDSSGTEPSVTLDDDVEAG